MSHTYALLEISEAAFAEIRAKLTAAGYSFQIQIAGDASGEREVIDMHGLALVQQPKDSTT